MHGIQQLPATISSCPGAASTELRSGAGKRWSCCDRKRGSSKVVTPLESWSEEVCGFKACLGNWCDSV